MNQGWHWFRGPSGRIVVVQCRSDAGVGSAWKLLPLSRTRPETYLAVVISRVPDRAAQDDAWTLVETEPMVLLSPDGGRHLEIVPTSTKGLMASRVAQVSGAVGLALGLLAWVGPEAIHPLLDRPVPHHERMSEGRIVLDRIASPEDRAIWMRGPKGWVRKPLEADKITGKAGNPSRREAKKRARTVRKTAQESN